MQREITSLKVIWRAISGSNTWSKLKRVSIVKTGQSSSLDHFSANNQSEFYAKTLIRYPSCNFDFVPNLLLLSASRVTCSFKQSLIDIVDVTKNLQLTLQKSSGKSLDGLDLKLWRDHLSQVSLFLKHILNCSFDMGLFRLQNLCLILDLQQTYLTRPRCLNRLQQIRLCFHRMSPI